MTDPVEAAARAMWREEWGTAAWPPAEDPEGAGAYRALARAAFPVIETAVLEKVAQMVEGAGLSPPWAEHIASLIRALKEQP